MTVGTRYRKSIKIAPGLKVNLTKRGAGLTIGTKGAHYTVHSSGRRTASVGLPGTGLSYVASHKAGGYPAAPAVRQVRNTPGLFAPKGEKLLYKALKTRASSETYEQLASDYPYYKSAALTLRGLLNLFDGAIDRSRDVLMEVFKSGYEPQNGSFIPRYANEPIAIPIIFGIEVQFTISRELVGVVLYILYKEAKAYDQAVKILSQIEQPSLATTVILAEANLLADHYEDTLKLTAGVTNKDDLTALALVYRARALAKLGYNDGALEVLKEALRFRSRAAKLRHAALYERAKVLAAQGKKAAAKKDLEKIFAEDAEYPNVAVLLRKI